MSRIPHHRKNALWIHPTKLELSQAVPREVDSGTNLTLKVNVSCPSGCDLRRGLVRVVGPDRDFAAIELVRHDETTNETEEFVFATPQDVGDHSWAIVFVSPEIGDTVHEESSLPLLFRTKSHSTSMAVWGAPTPVAMHSSFNVKVGVKCSAGCRLAGQFVQVSDEAGSNIGEGRLGEAPWPGTRGLYVAELSLPAPATEKVSSWSGSFVGDGLPSPHESASVAFSFRTAKPPEHTVVVKVTERDAGTPLAGVAVFMGVYRATTDARGLAKLELPKSTYELIVRKRDYEAPSMTVEVDRETTVEIQACLVPETNPDEEEVWM